VRLQRWVVDTGFTGDGFAWRHHFQEAGVDPDDLLSGPYPVVSPLGVRKNYPVREVDLWLFSNIRGFEKSPWRIVLQTGVYFQNIASLPHPELNAPLLGMRALENSGLKIKIDFPGKNVSVWIPGPWYRGSLSFILRAFGGFSTKPISWPK